MSPYLEVWGGPGRELIPLKEERVTVGKVDSNDLALTWDGKVSRLHAVFERYASGWCVRDLGSRNGTFVNGHRISSERALRPGDEITMGETRFVFRTSKSERKQSTTIAGEAPPELTRRERDVLVALCRPVVSGSLVTEPSSLRSIAAELVVSESAIKKHLGALYDKFGLNEPEERRRGRLAGEAIRRGAVTLSDL